jgi:hypothetical protein
LYEVNYGEDYAAEARRQTTVVKEMFRKEAV